MVAVQRWIIAAAAMYAALASGLAAVHVPHDRLVILLVQHALLLPALIAILRRASQPAAVTMPDVDRRILIALGLAVSVAVVAIAMFWDRGMLWGDETAYRIQAGIFASGRPWTDAPFPTSPDPALSAAELRFNHHIIHDGHWFTKYPPVWPAVLLLGDVANARWLVNPVLAVVALWIVYRIASRELALPVPGLAIVLLMTSPFFFMMAASQMSHMLGLVCCAGAVLCFLHGARTERNAGIAAAMALIGVCAFVRPFTAFCAALALAPFVFNVLFANRAREDFTGDRFDLNAARRREAPHMFLVDPGPARRAAVAAAERRKRWLVLGYDSEHRMAVILASGRAAPSR